MKALDGLAFGNAQDVPQGFPGPKRKIIMAYDVAGNEIGYLVTYWIE
ncbi:MAG: hypothetical protein R3C71_08420 [Candidatus Krumholzibacteriia bacterium]|nr:hypothetical protein [Candidatus Latescibacterota bacterium]MCB9515594.1 hypothetical protein [Candidatus Latescibacterota bacterium]